MTADGAASFRSAPGPRGPAVRPLRLRAPRRYHVPVGRILTPVRVENPLDPTRSIRFDALVDTGSSLTVLPLAWKERLNLATSETVEMETADQRVVTSEVAGPARIQIEGFRAVYSEVAFLAMEPQDGSYEPLLGYIVLEQSQAAVDMLGHRLVKVKALDLKSLHVRCHGRRPGSTCRVAASTGRSTWRGPASSASRARGDSRR